MEIKRTFWNQVNAPLLYAASTRKDVPIGSPSGMSLARLVRVTSEQAQLVSSLTEAELHAPVLDIDFPASLVSQAPITTLHVWGPTSTPGRLRQLGSALVACGFADEAVVKAWMARQADPPNVILPFTAPVRLVPSRSPGHHHLYIDQQTSWSRYRQLLCALAKAGVIAEDFLQLSLSNRASYLRTSPPNQLS